MLKLYVDSFVYLKVSKSLVIILLKEYDLQCLLFFFSSSLSVFFCISLLQVCSIFGSEGVSISSVFQVRLVDICQSATDVVQ